jgi:hypothetical protein
VRYEFWQVIVGLVLVGGWPIVAGYRLDKALRKAWARTRPAQGWRNRTRAVLITGAEAIRWLSVSFVLFRVPWLIVQPHGWIGAIVITAVMAAFLWTNKD